MILFSVIICTSARHRLETPSGKNRLETGFPSSRCSDRASEIYLLKCATGKGSVSAESLLLLFFLSESILHVRDFSK